MGTRGGTDMNTNNLEKYLEDVKASNRAMEASLNSLILELKETLYQIEAVQDNKLLLFPVKEDRCSHVWKWEQHLQNSVCGHCGRIWGRK